MPTQGLLVVPLNNSYQPCPGCVLVTWYIHSQFGHGCDLNLTKITFDLLYSTLFCYGAKC